MGGDTLPGEAFLSEKIPFYSALAPAIPTKLPIEARDGGIYQGFLLTWLYLGAIKRARAKSLPRAWILIALMLFVVAMAADGVNALLYDLQFYNGLENIPHLYVPTLQLRLVTGLTTGIAFAGILLPIANYFLWRADDARPLFENAKHFLGALAVGGIFGLLVNSEMGLFYYPIAIFSAASVVSLLSIINAVFLLSVFGKTAYATTWRAALNPLAAGACATVIELAALSLMRYTLLGTATLP
ncbi:MAG: DUF2085 domain-containing protein [Chloroflexi bacterium]|nr:DUF2085 domain-containing protein [Chloroflexota bacterium]